MDLKEIKRLIEMVEEAKISHFNIEVDSMKIEIKKEFAPISSVAPMVIPHMPAAQVVAAPTVAPAAVPEKSSELPKADDKLVPIKSQMVGTYYASPGPESPAYVKVGDRIDRGQILCIIEAMKLFNEIESEVSGVIEKICVTNATPVEYGQDLFLIRIG
ncbi:acetyl-CoA carboxylase biotin carboxyl carrier protein [bacterium]|nr:acetyl-CoA carboxylase biotin carboxyl carrier protein [bacterium]